MNGFFCYPSLVSGLCHLNLLSFLFAFMLVLLWETGRDGVTGNGWFYFFFFFLALLFPLGIVDICLVSFSQ